MRWMVARLDVGSLLFVVAYITLLVWLGRKVLRGMSLRWFLKVLVIWAVLVGGIVLAWQLIH